MLRMLNLLLGRNSYQPLNKVIVSRKNLLSNYRYLSKFKKGVKISPVLKSNAYGHGIVEVGKILDSRFRGNDIPFFCVDSIFEAYQLHRAKIKTPILIMGYVDPDNLKNKKLPFQYCLWDLDRAKALNSYQKNVNVHVFVDTGMYREGLPLGELKDFLLELKKLPNISLIGLMSHFAKAEDKSNQTKLQIKNFSKAIKIAQKLKIYFKYIHISNSPGLLNTPNYGCNVARVGKALYGIDPLDNSSRLRSNNIKPVLKMTTKLVQIKKLKKGGLVGYGGEFKAKKDMVLGILPLGYNDGLDRRLSNKGWVKLGNKFCRIIGKISMNITAVDLTDVKNPQVGDEVIVISDNQEDPNSIKNIARLCNTIPHDILVNLVPTTRRVVVDK